MDKIRPGEIFKIVNEKYEIGSTGDHFVILSTGEACTPDSWLIGCFWSFGNERIWGGARQKEFTPAEIYEIGEFVGYLPDLIKILMDGGKEIKTPDEWAKHPALYLTYNQAALLFAKSHLKITGETSDGYHTFNELYDHRCLLWINLCNLMPEKCYLVKEHFEGWFLLGQETEEGQISYHCPNKFIKLVGMTIKEHHPKFDGHTSKDVIERLKERPFRVVIETRNYSMPGCDGMITIPLEEYDKIKEDAWKYRELCK